MNDTSRSGGSNAARGVRVGTMNRSARRLIVGLAAAVIAVSMALAVSGRTGADSASVGSSPVSTASGAPRDGMAAAPYAYLEASDPFDPAAAMAATGVTWFTMAFLLSTDGHCDPRWDGERSLTGGIDQRAVARIRARGGDVIPSFGGEGGRSLEQFCPSASALAQAYQKVIDAYRLKAIDIDLEGAAYQDTSVQQRTIDALKAVRAKNRGITVFVTFPTGRAGPDAGLIDRAAAAGLTVDGWTIMPFDVGAAGADMGAVTQQATDGLQRVIKRAYGYTDDVAYRHAGISTMNGVTDLKETVTLADFRVLLAYARRHHLARFTFWSANRDRPCGVGLGTCSGVRQAAWDFTRVVAQYTG
jgi:hypothetical protein